MSTFIVIFVCVIVLILVIYAVCNRFCFHRWEDYNEDYQECTKCGLKIPIECNHKWEFLQNEYLSPRYDSSGRMHKYTGLSIIQQCSVCGEIRKKMITSPYE